MLAAGATPDRISYGNTIKKESEIAAAFKLGVTLFAVDCEAEVEKVARAAPGSRVICRIHCDGSGSEWPLSRKFGCEPDYAADILELAHKRGLVPHGVSFHVGSQQHNVEAWDRALASTAAIFRACAERGITLAMVNLGGGFPAQIRPQDAKAREPTARRSSSRCASTSATTCRTPSSSRAAASSAMPALSRPRWC